MTERPISHTFLCCHPELQTTCREYLVGTKMTLINKKFQIQLHSEEGLFPLLELCHTC